MRSTRRARVSAPESAHWWMCICCRIRTCADPCFRWSPWWRRRWCRFGRFPGTQYTQSTFSAWFRLWGHRPRLHSLPLNAARSKIKYEYEWTCAESELKSTYFSEWFRNFFPSCTHKSQHAHVAHIQFIQIVLNLPTRHIASGSDRPRKEEKQMLIYLTHTLWVAVCCRLDDSHHSIRVALDSSPTSHQLCILFAVKLRFRSNDVQFLHSKHRTEPSYSDQQESVVNLASWKQF